MRLFILLLILFSSIRIENVNANCMLSLQEKSTSIDMKRYRTASSNNNPERILEDITINTIWYSDGELLNVMLNNIGYAMVYIMDSYNNMTARVEVDANQEIIIPFDLSNYEAGEYYLVVIAEEWYAEGKIIKDMD